MKKNDDGTTNVHWKGAAEMILAMFSNTLTNMERQKRNW